MPTRSSVSKRTEVEGADVVVVSYGITSRIAVKAIQDARKEGIKVGSLRLITIWPFCEKRIRELAGKVKAIVVPEINYGQMVLEVERCAAGKCKVISVNHCGGAVHDPEVILEPSERETNEYAISRQFKKDSPMAGHPAHGPDAAHLVSRLRHRLRGERLCRGGQAQRHRPRQAGRGFRHRLHRPRRRLRRFRFDPHHARPRHSRGHRPQAGQPGPEGGGVQRRGRPDRHRRQPLHPCRPPQHGHGGDLQQQLHLRHDRRPGDADHAAVGALPRPRPTATTNIRSACRSWPMPPAPPTSRAGRRCMRATSPSRSRKR